MLCPNTNSNLYAQIRIENYRLRDPPGFQTGFGKLDPVKVSQNGTVCAVNRRVAKAAAESEQKMINLGGDSTCHTIKPPLSAKTPKRGKRKTFLFPDGDASRSARSHWFARPSTGSSSGSTLTTSRDPFVPRIRFSVSKDGTIRSEEAYTLKLSFLEDDRSPRTWKTARFHQPFKPNGRVHRRERLQVEVLLLIRSQIS